MKRSSTAIVEPEEPEKTPTPELPPTPKPPTPQFVTEEFEVPTNRNVIGKQINELLDEGFEIPEAIIVDLIADKIERLSPGSHWMIDGYPENTKQVKLMVDRGVDINALVLVEASDDTCIQRYENQNAQDCVVQKELMRHHEHWGKVEKFYAPNVYQVACEDLEAACDAVEAIYYKFAPSESPLPTPSVSLQSMTIQEGPLSIEPTPTPSDLPSEVVVSEKKSGETLPRTPQTTTPTNPTPETMVSEKSSIRTLPMDDPTNECRVIDFIEDRPFEKKISVEVFQTLRNIWEKGESVAQNRAKIILGNIRNERETSIQYLAAVVCRFNNFINRPDPRQEFLFEWQLDYNSTNYELRSDDEAKCELHQKWADLWVRIEEVTVERKEENTKMRIQLLHNNFLKEKIEAVGKHFFHLCRVEAIRLGSHCLTLRRYYAYQACAEDVAKEDTDWKGKPYSSLLIDADVDNNDPIVNKELVMKKAEDLCKEIFKEIDDRRDYEFEMAKKIVSEAKADQQAAGAAAGGKGKDKKGAPKKDKTPEPIDPALEEEIKRKDICRRECLEAIRLQHIAARRRVENIRSNLLNFIEEITTRYVDTFSHLNEILKQHSEDTVLVMDTIQEVVHAGIESAEPIEPTLNIVTPLRFDFENVQPICPPEHLEEAIDDLHPVLQMKEDFECLGPDSVRTQDLREIVNNYYLGEEIIEKSDRQWRKILFGCIEYTEEFLETLRSAENQVVSFMEWIELTEGCSPISELGWELSEEGELDLDKIISLLELVEPLRMHESPQPPSQRTEEEHTIYEDDSENDADDEEDLSDIEKIGSKTSLRESLYDLQSASQLNNKISKASTINDSSSVNEEE